MNQNDRQLLSKQIKQLALDQGFNACGISKIVPLYEEKKHLEQWLEKGYNGDMGYMERNMEKRVNPSILVEGTQSVISVLLNYYPVRMLPDSSHYKISKYAYGKDYHFVVKEKLKVIMDYLEEKFPGIPMRAFTDSAPVFDKSWALKSGLAWMGKHSLLLNKQLGSFFFVGEIIVGLDLQADKADYANYCGTCTKCIDACPTDAIVDPYIVDANRCISYLTIETKNDIPAELKPQLDNWIFGCDICQDVCPWNSKAQPTKEPAFHLSDSLYAMKKQDWEQMEKPLFKELFKDSPIQRAGFKKLKNTII